MVSELRFSRLGGQLWAAAVENDRIVEIHHEWPDAAAASIGAIYLAKVSRVVPQLGAAFVSLSPGCEGYLEADDILGEGAAGEKLRLLRSGQPILVQVKREAHASKRARVSAKLDLAGTYMTVRPYGSGVAVSRRIRDEAERGRLARWARSSGGRVLVRTAAQGVADGRLQEERDRLARRVARLTRAARSGTAPGLLEAGPGVLRRLVRDYAARGLSRVVVETDADETAAADLLSDRGLLERHDGPGALVHSAGIWDATQRALEPRVELASGASLTVEPTQAFWAIDVDAGRVRRTGDVPAASAINLEAADRIGAEIRLRDLAGTIVIDFLSAAGDGEREEVVGRLRRSLRADRRYLRIAGWTRLGLCEVARRREGRSLLERLGPPDRPTPWARAARVLADAAKEPASRQPRRVTADRATARALRASIEAAEGSFEPRLEIEETG